MGSWGKSNTMMHGVALAMVTRDYNVIGLKYNFISIWPPSVKAESKNIFSEGGSMSVSSEDDAQPDQFKCVSIKPSYLNFGLSLIKKII